MSYKVLIKIWALSSISFIGLMITLIYFVVVDDITIITKPIPTLVALSIVLPLAILLLTGNRLLHKIKKRELENS